MIARFHVEHVCAQLALDLYSDDNMFAPLQGIVEEPQVYMSPEPINVPKRSIVTAVRKPKQNQPTDTTPDQTATTKLTDYLAKINTIATKWAKHPEEIANWVYRKEPDNKYLRLVADKCWGQGWDLRNEIDSAQWFVYCRLNKVHRLFEAIKYLECSPTWVNLPQQKSIPKHSYPR